MKVLRPQTKYGGGFNWVHIANDDGHPLCGKAYGADYSLLQENADLDTLTVHTLCSRCAATDNQFSFEVLQAGQARRYADSWYKYKITDLADEPRDQAAVLSFCRRWLRKAYDKADMPHPFAPQMTGCTQSLGGTWRYNVRELYTG